MQLRERAHNLLKEVEYEKMDEELIGQGTRNQQRYKASIGPPYSQELQHDKLHRRQAYSISTLFLPFCHLDKVIGPMNV
jgi:hypothetical protein